MNVKVLVIAILALVGAYALGRYTSPVKVETKIVEVEKKQTETERDKRKETTTTVVEKPDGTKETVTRTVEDTSTRKSTETNRNTDTETSKTYAGPKTYVGGLSGIDTANGSVFYGAQVNRQVLGPVSVGGFFLTNKTLGVSIGLQF